MQNRPSTSDAAPRLQRSLLKIQPYDFETKYTPGKEVALVDVLSRVNSQEEMQLKSLDFTVHELTPCNMDVNNMCWIEEGYNSAVTVQFASRVAQVLQRSGPSPQGIRAWDIISILRMAALHISVDCLFHLADRNSVWSCCIGVIQGYLGCILGGQNRAYIVARLQQREPTIPIKSHSDLGKR